MPDASEVVCHRCFSDKSLRAFAKEAGSRGACPWCGRRGWLVPLEALAEPFREVASIYAPAQGFDAYERGSTISSLLDEDWQVFDDYHQIADQSQDLVEAILYADIRDRDRVNYPDYTGLFCQREMDLVLDWDRRASDALTRGLPVSGHDGLQTVAESIDSDLPSQIEVAFEDLSTVLQRGAGSIGRGYTMTEIAKPISRGMS